MTYLLLFAEFFKIGLFAVGGGLAALPFLYELAGKYDWFTPADVTYMIAISESTPGPIAINMTTFVGYHTAGLPGSAIATAGVVLPQMIIVLLIAKALERFRSNRYVQAGFAGIRPAVTAMISVALFEVAKISLVRWQAFTGSGDWSILVDGRAVVLFGAALFAVLKFKRHPILYIAAGAAAGVLIAP